MENKMITDSGYKEHDEKVYVYVQRQKYPHAVTRKC
jgi:hypothetical protein